MKHQHTTLHIISLSYISTVVYESRSLSDAQSSSSRTKGFHRDLPTSGSHTISRFSSVVHRGSGLQQARVHSWGRIMGKKCGHPECTTRPSNGIAGSKKPEFCSRHAQDGMVNIYSKRCGHEGCTTQSNYGVAGSKKPEFCGRHAQDGMVNVYGKRCVQEGCTTQPRFGVAGSKKPEFCSRHAQDGMIDVSSKRCGQEGCTTQPKYGIAGSKKPEFCSRHAQDEMVNIYSKKICGHEGCTTQSNYGVAGSKTPEFCSRHAKEGMTHHRSGRVLEAGNGGVHEQRDERTIRSGRVASGQKQRKRPPTPASNGVSVDNSVRATKRTRQADGTAAAVSVAVKAEAGGTISQAKGPPSSEPTRKGAKADVLLPCSVKAERC